MAGGGFEEAGFVNDAGKIVDNAAAGESLGVSDADEGDVSTLEELFHVFRVATGVVLVVFAVVDLDGTDGAESAFIAKDEIDGFVFDKEGSGIAVARADFVAEEGGEADTGDYIEFLTKKLI